MKTSWIKYATFSLLAMTIAIVCFILYKNNSYPKIGDVDQAQAPAQIQETIDPEHSISSDFKDKEYKDWKKFENTEWNYKFYYPQDWNTFPQVEKEAFQKNQRVILKSNDDKVFLNIYSFRKSENESLTEWVKANQRSIYYDFVDSIQKPNAFFSGYESLVISKCEDSNHFQIFIDASDKVHQMWITGVKLQDLSLFLSSISFNNKPGFVKLPDKDLIYTDASCEKNDSSPPPADSSKTCTYDAASTSDCCGKFTDSEVDYWNCSKNSYGSYGNCVWWAAYKRPDMGNAAAYHPGQGDAGHWDYWARSENFLVDDCPRVGDVYINDSNREKSGHVAYVEKILGSDEIAATSMAWCSKCMYETKYKTINRKFIHSQEKEVVFYWDKANEISQELNVPGSCGGKTNVWNSVAGEYNMPEWFIDQASAILIPDGWSIWVYDELDQRGANVCLNSTETSLEDIFYDGTNVALNKSISSYEVFFDDNCRE